MSFPERKNRICDLWINIHQILKKQRGEESNTSVYIKKTKKLRESFKKSESLCVCFDLVLHLFSLLSPTKERDLNATAQIFRANATSSRPGSPRRDMDEMKFRASAVVTRDALSFQERPWQFNEIVGPSQTKESIGHK